ncbi:putative sporulation protein YtxC [Thermoactinomyces mirandus]|uniref:Putative sporulation protein YtxC n=1 Tax=Thermoactinomyces mirandus TaxID=2756294 RepID=A0A7W1XRD8_9BACL|nr:putative sporulation protein YtxC [Thermoactinomyces mirandus]MBA4601645.1 putative sporulation protein YtxC [Thermoactinomyces mirandus]
MLYIISFALKDRTQIAQFGPYLKDLCEGIKSVCPVSCAREMMVRDRYVVNICLEPLNNGKKRRIVTLFGKILADFFCDVLEPKWILKMIQTSPNYLSREEMDEIRQCVTEQLETSAWECANEVYSNRREKIARQISCHLDEYQHLAVDGFSCFRLKTYWKTLAICVEEAIHTHLLNRRYKEFINLLRTFVQLQIPKLPLVHVIHKGKNQFHVVKADGTPILAREMEPSFLEIAESTSSHGDYMISILLSMAPERIMLHTSSPQENVIQTLFKVFEGRVMICDGCSKCHPSVFHFQEDA